VGENNFAQFLEDISSNVQFVIDNVQFANVHVPTFIGAVRFLDFPFSIVLQYPIFLLFHNS